MTINTARTSASDPKRNAPVIPARTGIWVAMGWLFLVVGPAHATTEIGPWVPIFKGIDHTVGTNTPAGGGFSTLQVMHALRVDLEDPDIRLFATPRISTYVPDSQETGGLTVGDFLEAYKLQVAINANDFSPSDYYLPAGTPMDIEGTLISQGEVVSSQEANSRDPSAIYFTTNNQVTLHFTNWPPASTLGVFTAVSGTYPVLVNGVNVGSNYIGNPAFIHQLNPRTALGVSPDERYVFLVTIDGRQAGYSDGALDWQTAAWLILLGASDGINLDGGGSATMVMADATGSPVELNHSSAVADSGRERTVGAHLGVFAKPVPGFINDVNVLPDDQSATITWTTLSPSTTQVRFGPTPALGSSTALQSEPVTNHTAFVAGLKPDTGYYFRAVSAVDTDEFLSAPFFFVTTNYVTTNLLFDLDHTWTYTTTNLDATNWTSPAYDDSGWTGSGPGLLWADNRGAPHSDIAALSRTPMPWNPATGNPFTTYYLRTHFTFTNDPTGVSLLFSAYIDDGAVFHLNGAELKRVRMDDYPTPIDNATLATGYPCAGNASCTDDFEVSGDPLTNLVSGDNVLAVEVHNYNAGSRDITFGTALSAKIPYALSPQLSVLYANGTVTLSWNRGGFVLQQADAAAGTWTDVPGPVVLSPFSAPASETSRFYRLHR